jgi:hypothetical protein
MVLYDHHKFVPKDHYIPNFVGFEESKLSDFTLLSINKSWPCVSLSQNPLITTHTTPYAQFDRNQLAIFFNHLTFWSTQNNITQQGMFKAQPSTQKVGQRKLDNFQ